MADNGWFDKGDIIPTIIALVAGYRSGKNTGSDGEDQKQKIVSVLHAFFSKVDEGMWTSLMARLNQIQWLALTRLLEFLDRFHEKESFRLTVVDAPTAVTIIDDVPDPSDRTGVKKIQKVIKVGEYSDQDNRVIFLRKIADLVDDDKWGVEKVRDMLRTHQLATENKIAKYALTLWKGFQSWAEKTVREIFGVNSLGEITPKMLTDMVAGEIHTFATKIPEVSDADLSSDFWKPMYKRHPVFAVILAITIIASIALFAILPTN